MKRLTVPAIVFSTVAMLSSEVALSDQHDSDCDASNSSMGGVCNQLNVLKNTLPSKEEFSAKVMSPEVMVEQNTQMQQIMLKQDVWVNTDGGGRNNIRFFKEKTGLSAFYTNCASSGGERAIPAGDPAEKAQGLFQGSCLYPK